MAMHLDWVRELPTTLICLLQNFNSIGAVTGGDLDAWPCFLSPSRSAKSPLLPFTCNTLACDAARLQTCIDNKIREAVTKVR